MKILMAAPNVSEGRDLDVVCEIAEAIKRGAGARADVKFLGAVPGAAQICTGEGVASLCVDAYTAQTSAGAGVGAGVGTGAGEGARADVKFLGAFPDADHNRTVFSYIGDPEAVLEATKRLAEAAFRLVDMTTQKGVHPRIGALDVVPFIPIKNVTTVEAVEISRQFGEWVGSKGIPVYYYEDSATNPNRVNLPDVRRGQYEGLEARLADPEWTPDEGPAQFVPKTGAVLTCARAPLIAFNVNLRTNDVSIAKNIARAVRHISGGYRYVRAIGLALETKGISQVSMNLINYKKTPLPRVLETIRSEAARYGVSIAGTELIGLMPTEAIEEIMRFYVQCHDFTSDQLIELNCLPE